MKDLKVLFIINRAAGKYNEELVTKCTKAVKEFCNTIEVIYPKNQTEFRNIVRKALGEYDVVVVGGGDGTIGLTVDTLRGHEQLIAILPLGRGNSFYKSIYGETDPCESLVKALAQKVIQKVDIGYIVELDRFFVLGASMGFIAEVLRNARKYTFLGGRTAYTLAAIERILRGIPSACCEVLIENVKVYTGEFSLLAVGMTMYRAGRFKLFPNAKLDDGRADYLVIPPLPRTLAFRLLRASITGRHVEFSNVVYGSTSALSFICKSPMPVEVDGDLIGYLDRLTINVKEKGLSIVVPRL